MAGELAQLLNKSFNPMKFVFWSYQMSYFGKYTADGKQFTL
jgi:hypothetical protein